MDTAQDVKEEYEGRIKELGQEAKDWNFCQAELEKQYLRVEKLESVLKECIDDPLFKVWLTDKYNRFKPLLKKDKP